MSDPVHPLSPAASTSAQANRDRLRPILMTTLAYSIFDDWAQNRVFRWLREWLGGKSAKARPAEAPVAVEEPAMSVRSETA